MTAIQNVFKRNDAQVQEDALNLEFDAFKRKYESLAKDTVLSATWKDARRKAKLATQTDEATNLPEVVKTTETPMSDGSLLTNQTFANGTQVASVDNEPGAEEPKSKKDKKGGKKEEKAAPKEKAKPAPKADGTKTRAERLRELIAEGKDKTASKEILVNEGYDVATIHSEWNRLTKKKD